MLHSLLHRLPPTDQGRKPTLNEPQPDLHPLEVLFDVQKLMQERNVCVPVQVYPQCLNRVFFQQQPLSASFEKIVQAMGLYDHWTDVQSVTALDAEQWGQHAVQSIVWYAAGMYLKPILSKV
jgi:anaphase-promoting complex subunit 5